MDSLLVSPVFPSHFFSLFLPSFFTKPHSKCSELEEELKNVTNNLKSLEAQAEKVGLLFPRARNVCFAGRVCDSRAPAGMEIMQLQP